jgi:hypothetical protein
MNQDYHKAKKKARKILPCNVKNVLTNYDIGYIIMAEIPRRVKLGGDGIDSTATGP